MASAARPIRPSAAATLPGPNVGRSAPGARALALSWSGGKDSSLALSALRESRADPIALLTTVTEEYDRVSMHGVRVELLRSQAAAIGLPLVEVSIPAQCSNEIYEQRMAQALTSRQLASTDAVAFGDLFLEDIRAYREQRLAEAGKRGVFPIWGRDTTELARQFVSEGFEAVLVCIDPRQLDPAFAGRRYDERLLAELPDDVDPCGENGEFHTFVHSGPIFSEPVGCEVGEVSVRDGFAFCDVLPRASSPHGARGIRGVPAPRGGRGAGLGPSGGEAYVSPLRASAARSRAGR